ERPVEEGVRQAGVSGAAHALAPDRLRRQRGVFRSKGRPTRIFFAADLHGSQPTFRKFLGAAAFYECDALVFGGDLMGKALVPIVRSNGVFRAHFQGSDHEFDQDGLEAFTRSVELPGFYWHVFEPDEYEAVN